MYVLPGLPPRCRPASSDLFILKNAPRTLPLSGPPHLLPTKPPSERSLYLVSHSRPPLPPQRLQGAPAPITPLAQLVRGPRDKEKDWMAKGSGLCPCWPRYDRTQGSSVFLRSFTPLISSFLHTQPHFS